MFACVLSCVCVCVFFLTTGTRWVILYSNLGWLVYFKQAGVVFFCFFFFWGGGGCVFFKYRYSMSYFVFESGMASLF